jgi:hypothetical protein
MADVMKSLAVVTAFSNRFLVGKTGCNGRGEDTTAPMRVLGVRPRRERIYQTLLSLGTLFTRAARALLLWF